MTTPTPSPAPTLEGRSVTVDRKGRFYLRLSCPAGGAECKGNVKVRTATAVAAATKRVLVLAARAYKVAAGKTARVRMTLSAKGRKLLRRKGKIRARATFAPAGGGAKTTARLTLKKKP